MVKTYLKTLERMFTKHITRFFSIILIVLVSVGFVAGIGTATDKIKASLSDYYRVQNVSDLILKNTADGFSQDEIKALKARYGENNVNTGMSVDVNLSIDGEEQLVRLYFLDEFERPTVNRWDSLEKAALTDVENAVYADQSDHKIKGIAPGTQIELDFADILRQLAAQNGEEPDETVDGLLDNLKRIPVTVTEKVQSPLTFACDGEPSYTNSEEELNNIPNTVDAVNSLITLDNILYLPSGIIPTLRDAIPEEALKLLDIPPEMLPYLPAEALQQIEELKKLMESADEPLLGTGDIYIAFEDRSLFNAFSPRYKTYLNEEKAEISALLGGEFRFISLYDNFSFISLNSYAEKVMAIGYVLMVAFLFVTALVVLSTMTRLLEEERSQIACLKTIGYPNAKIIFKYVLFAMIATGIGGVCAYFVEIGIARLLYIVFEYSFVMPPMSQHVAMLFFLITFTFIVLATLLATALAGRKLTNEKPANLLRPKVPKAGKKVIIEKIPFLWNMLSFKYKSTVRNVLRYKNRFFMTVVAVAISTALVLTGLALLDVCLFGGLESVSIMLVAVVVVVFAGLLTAVVIYTLTNINISERNRELATLMVLGYYDGEVAGYIYREIYIDTVIGIIFGYPLSLLLMYVVFDIMAMGTITGVSWFMWLAAPVIVLLFTFIVTMLLRHKIVKIDMNESLKAVE